MKLKISSVFAPCLAAVLVLTAGPTVSSAQDEPGKAEGQAEEEQEKEKEKDSEERDGEDPEQEPESGEAQAPLSPKELEERLKKEAEAEKEAVGRMMKVFNSLEGAWTGQETLRYEENRLPEKTWKDEWEGKFTFGGRYFEMAGQTAGEDMNSAYKWICTYDVLEEKYRAWYFGDNAHNEYSGTLSQDGRHVIWSIRGATGSVSRFTMKAEGNRVKCHGTDTLADGTLFSTQTSEYTKKRVEL